MTGAKWLASAAVLVAFATCARQGDGGDAGAPPPDDSVPQTLAPAAAGEGADPWDEGWTVAPTERRGAPAPPVAVLEEARAAANQGFDRVVFEFAAEPLPGYRVEYLEGPARRCGSGEAAEVVGQERLQVRFVPAQAHDDQGRATVEERSQAPGLRAVRALALTCDFEADVTWVLGVSAPGRPVNGAAVQRPAYRVMELKEPARLVVDVRH